ncbi:Leucine-rich repeat receptor-like tyrosine-protein kinase PXC3 [Striga hermonthica]|uniref:Leucine-rich repeat receptor-like tyrosine-protein kinase PXC3 n=1 Tax=Striga hermonthica TaxID=68872 RepID=A0A9N7NDS7_STRHE|nr:Leucine-rich repeat receptor-like tyrosine-protein kinase PXC3 [Striga hermonthica]
MVDSDQGLTLLQIQTEFHVSKWSAQNTSDFCILPGISCNNSLVEALDLSNQGLRGNLTLISQLKSLKSLDLSFNNFNGLIPPALAELSELEFLDLSFNSFDGPIPLEFSKLKNLRALNLSGNFLTGDIPKELESLKKLESLQLFTNRLNATIPSWVGSLTGLRIFTAYENDLTGFIPDELGLHSELQLLNLHSNELEGPIPESIFSMQKLETLVLTQNRLNGYIPKSIGKCKTLSSIRIGNNNLSGLIPKEIGDISGLTYFEANENGLYGEIVPDFSKCTNLTLLNLASNRFNGTVPSEFGLLSNLQELIVSDNDLFGEMPVSVLRVRSLNKLDLSYNRFNGTIPASICNVSRLQFLLLEHNSLEGEIPHEIGNCTKLLELQLGSNRLSGSIPPEIGHIKNLQIALNLSFNRLNGQLPEELGRLDKLVALDLSANQLTGNIPSTFRGMLSLIEVNFSNNRLTGPIPNFVPFQKSPNSSFIGNKALCGEPLTVSCGNSNDFNSGYYSYHHKVSYKIVLTVIGSGLAVFASVSVVVWLFMMREKQEKAAKEAKMVEEEINEDPKIIAGDIFVESLKQAIDFEAVAKATMKESSKLSVGTFSVVYKADMPSGVILSVRKLKPMVHKTVLNHQSKMIREVEKLSKLRHDNLMRPIGFVLFEDDVVLLLHQYYPNGTLAQFLHDSAGNPDYKPDWPVRLAIAIGVAEGLAFLHNVAIIHLDISSGNLVLDSSFNPLLGEVEVSKLLDPSRGTASISAVAGSFGYMPPEYAYTMQVTAPGNVYSYGVVLLEILTTRLPVDEAFGEGIDLVKWVHGAPTRGETPEQILDPRLSTVSFGWRKDMLAALKVALLCTDNTPAKRPKMKDVVEMLKEIGNY